VTATADRALVITAPRRAEIRPLPRPEGPLHVRTLYSGVSLGTELSYFTGTNPMLRARLDPVLGLFHPVDAQQYPITRLGYMEVAKVEHDASALGLTPGTPVAMTYGHRTGWAVDPLAERVVPLPADLDPVLGVLVAHMGPICANGLLHAAAEEHGPDVRTLGDGVRGRRVAVVGAGTVGLLTALFARVHGAAEVVVIDPTPARRAVAAQLGLEGIDPAAVDPAVVLKSRWRHGPGDRGADVVLQCRGQLSAETIALQPSRVPRRRHRGRQRPSRGQRRHDVERRDGLHQPEASIHRRPGGHHPRARAVGGAEQFWMSDDRERAVNREERCLGR